VRTVNAPLSPQQPDPGAPRRPAHRTGPRSRTSPSGSPSPALSATPIPYRCYGLDHLTHGGSLAGILDRTGQRPYLIADFVPAAREPGDLARKLSRYSQDTAIPTAGTWLGSADAGQFFPGQCGLRLGSLIDAALYLGQPENLTVSWWNPAIFLDPAYWQELQHRNALKGNRVDLDSYRQEQSALYPLFKVPPSECHDGAVSVDAALIQDAARHVSAGTRDLARTTARIKVIANALPPMATGAPHQRKPAGLSMAHEDQVALG
jgi:hypothetical protein